MGILQIALILQQLFYFICATTCPPGYTLSGSAKTCYRLVSTPKQWADARADCKTDGGDLISLDNEAKFFEFRDIAKAKGSSTWVGGFETKDGRWIWVNDHYIDYGWASDEPNYSDEDCVEFTSLKDFYLNNIHCHDLNHFVCEVCPLITKCTDVSCASSSIAKCRRCKDNNVYYKVSQDGRHCDACPRIAKCVDQYCRTGLQATKCRKCEDNKVFYRVSSDETNCEKLCAWNNHHCWPGTCGDGLVKSCYCTSGFHLTTNSSETSCQLQSKPSFETCDTRTLVLGGKMVMSKTIGNTTACQNQNDYYGNFQPDQHHFNVLVRFSVDTSTFPLKKPTYIDSFNFGITDFTVEIISRRIGGSYMIEVNEYIEISILLFSKS